MGRFQVRCDIKPMPWLPFDSLDQSLLGHMRTVLDQKKHPASFTNTLIKMVRNYVSSISYSVTS